MKILSLKNFQLMVASYMVVAAKHFEQMSTNKTSSSFVVSSVI